MTGTKRGRGPIRLLVALVLALAVLRGGVAAWESARGLTAKPYGILMPGRVRPPRSLTPIGTP
ncbi:hypothetical protein DA075_07035 [Methylobacterium currus]|uniref:Uncharacterized protein n=1 Tax=Methylobacterium currus TaxID=2051553 RepID=A0A2R4WGN8_9HYPH|nr:hypothetical protein DA075_07035 [Methylobacterium currus]